MKLGHADTGVHPKQKTQTIIVSDIHLGLEITMANALLRMLRSWEFSTLILNGDIFDGLDFDGINEEQWELLSYLRELTHNTNVIWIRGNHDRKLAKLISCLMGTKVYHKHIWEQNGMRLCAIHGHQFDRFLGTYGFFNDLGSRLYGYLQKIEPKNRILSRYIKKRIKRWKEFSGKLAQRAVRYASFKNVNVVFCGHTHQAEHRIISGIHYYNSGCWTDSPATFIHIDDIGIHICEYE